MKNKKGFLLAEETLKIIIAVIAIGFLVYFLVSLYFSAKASKETEQSEETLNFILSEAAAGRAGVDVYNPKNWWILFKDGELCICEDNNAESCEDKGICLNNNGFSLESPIKIENPPITLNIGQTNKKITG